ncbi:MAG: DUF2007 domain-containing protein [Gammaproteobacteria bacterium]
MKKVYTNANRTVVLNVQNLLEGQGIKTFLRNEYAVGAMGEMSPFDAWLEVWVVDDRDTKRAKEFADSAISQQNAAQWMCNRCSESNDPSFEFCWNCQSDASSTAGAES